MMIGYALSAHPAHFPFADKLEIVLIDIELGCFRFHAAYLMSYIRPGAGFLRKLLNRFKSPLLLRFCSFIRHWRANNVIGLSR